MPHEPVKEDWVDRLVAYQEGLEAAVDPQANGETTSAKQDAELDPELGEHQQCLKLLHALRQTGHRPGRSTPSTSSGSKSGWSDPPAGIARPRFELLEQLGVGGFGIVWQARDPRTGRLVALKIPRPEVLARADLRRRFRREAEIAARLDHPNILPIFEAGVDGMVPYIVSPYYDAPTLAEWLAASPGPVAPRLAAQIARALADALDHAHARGVLHRDVKPSNVLLISDPAAAEAGGMPFVPKLMDFGLAKLSEETRDLTRTGEILGTVRYVSPEQACGKTREIGPKSDVYCLGAVLYELLTGSPPFAASSDLEVLRRMQLEEPSRVRAKNASVPKDLETICLKCLEKDPAHRYRSADALREDLNRLLAGKPILARSSTMSERLVKWGRRKPALAALAVVTLLAVVGLLGGLSWSNLRISRALAQAQLSEQIARQRAHEARQYAYASDMQLADRAWRANDLAVVTRILERYEQQATDGDVRGAEWRRLRTAVDSPSVILGEFSGEVGCVAGSADGERFAASSTDGQIRVWDANARQELWQWTGPGQLAFNGLRFSPNGLMLAVASDDKSAHLFDSITGTPLGAFQGGHTDWVAEVDFSPDGTQLATVGADGRLLLWAVESRSLIRQVHQHDGELRCVRFLADGEHLAVGAELGQVEIFHSGTGQKVATLANPASKRSDEESGVWPRKIGVRGHLLAAAYVGGGLTIWDMSWPAMPAMRHHVANGVSRSVGFLTNEMFVVGRSDHAVEIRVLDQVEPELVYQGHSHQVLSVAGSFLRGEVISGSKDGTVRLWSTRRAETHQVIAQFDENVKDLAASPQQDKLAVATAAKIEIFELPSGRKLAPIDIPNAISLSWSADGRQLACAPSADSFAVCDFLNDGSVQVRKFERESVELVRISPFTEMLLVQHDSQLQAFDRRTLESRWMAPANRSISAIAFSPDGRWVFAAEHAGNICVLDAQNGMLYRELKHHRDRVHAVCVSADGKRLATSCGGRGDAIWNLETGEIEQMLATSPVAKTNLQFSADGRNLFGVSDVKSLSCWHVPTGQQTVTLTTFPGEVALCSIGIAGQESMYVIVREGGRDQVVRFPLP